MVGNFRMLAKTQFGMEQILANELRNLGAGDIKMGVRNVSFDGDLGFMYKANLCLRTALKILKPLNRFKVFHEKDLYHNVFRMDWAKYFEADCSIAVDTTMHSKVFNNSMFVSQKVKDGIVDKFRRTAGRRPSVNSQDPDVRINVHLYEENCTISLDSSGNSLHQRGYRIETNLAPINEVLAAGMLLLSGWDGRSDFYDPMCGSGTLLIEAAMIACNIPANINREAYCFQKWADFDATLFDKIKTASLNKIRPFTHKIVGTDKAPSAVRKATENVAHANLSEFITIERKDFFRSEPPISGSKMVFNPPYGERLTIDAPEFYKKIGDTLKASYAGSDVWFLSSNLEALKFVGLRPSKKVKLFNGKLESRLLQYEIFSGDMSSHKRKKHETKA
ncbi:MAG: THUMP domain-containing protein [Bacteroidota bacterium]